MKLFKRYFKNQLYIEVEIIEHTPVHHERYIDIEVRNPRLIGVFFAEIIFQLSLRTKQERIDFKNKICSQFDISHDTLKKALWRYYQKQYAKMEFNKVQNPIDFELVNDHGTLDHDHWTDDIRELAQTMTTVPSNMRDEKYERALQYIGERYGKYKDPVYKDYYKYCLINIMKKGTLPYNKG